MNAYRIDAQTLLVPFCAEGPDGLVGDGMEKIGSEHPDFAAWLPFAIPYPEKMRLADEERQREAERAAEFNARRRTHRAALRARSSTNSHQGPGAP